MWWSRYPRWVNTHTHTLTAPHTRIFTTLNSPPLCLVASRAGAHAVSTAHGQCTQYITLFQIHPDHTYYMHCLVFHVCLSQLFGVVVLLVAPAKWSDWASTAYDVIVGAASMHCAQNWANPLVYVLMTGECERVTQSCVLLYGFIWFMLKWSFVYKMSVVNWYRDYWNMYCFINGTSKEGVESGL